MPETGWLINNKHLFITVLEDEKSKIVVLANSVSSETCFLVHRMCLPAVISHDGRGKGALSGLFYKGTNPVHRSFTLVT